jgi:aspartate/methionine/tyrosine aminotransferase
VRFSARTPHSEPNALARLVADKRAAGVRIHDLTISNPTTAGIAYPDDELAAALADRRALIYAPDPRGQLDARRAVAPGHDPDRVFLTASTSEAYAWLFKLLCDPGDAVLAPAPSYPLFDHLAALEGIGLATYPLAWDGEWHVDLPALEAAIDGRTRAILVVSPNNPTGSYLKRGEWARLQALGLPLIVDEVFADYPAHDAPAPDRVTCAAAEPDATALTFSLGGLSKSAGLPQLKLGWIRVAGARDVVDEACARLELVADSYLSVGASVQAAAPRLVELGARVRRDIQARVRASRAALGGLAMPAEAGWSAIIRLPAVRTDEDVALALLRDHDTLVQPGYFYDFGRGTYIVVSLLAEPAELARLTTLL